MRLGIGCGQSRGHFAGARRGIQGGQICGIKGLAQGLGNLRHAWGKPFCDADFDKVFFDDIAEVGHRHFARKMIEDIRRGGSQVTFDILAGYQRFIGPLRRLRADIKIARNRSFEWIAQDRDEWVMWG